MVAPSAQPFSPAALAGFVEHVPHHLRRLGIDVNLAAAMALGATQLLAARGLAAASDLHQKLEAQGVRRGWNAALGDARAAFLAAAVAPHVVGSVVDVLCGDGEMARRLAAVRGRPVAVTERHADYPGLRRAHPEIRNFCGRRGPGSARFDTALLVTVLHHEDDPEALLAHAVKLARRRVIVVENCIETRYPADFQQLMDVFFNQILNTTCLRSPGRHRRASHWCQLLRRYGAVAPPLALGHAPGVPLGHTLMVVEVGR